MDRREFLKFGLLFSYVIFFDKYLPGGYKRKNYSSLYIFEDELELIKNKIEEFNNMQFPESLGDLLIEVAKTFLGTKYESGTLDIFDDREELILKISGFDCVTFVENVLTFGRLIKNNKLTIENFLEELKLIRYRSGIINGFTSRLHYFSDWIYDNSQKGVVIDLVKELGGSNYDKVINFMTEHPSYYKQLNKNKKLLYEMKDVEEKITQREKFYIKLNEIEKYFDKLANGDIFALTTNIEGLDVSHTGFILIDEDVKIIHASQKFKKVVISTRGIKDYMLSIKNCSGLMVARPII